MQDRQAAARDREAAAHERAEHTHERAAQAHERAAEFWHEHGHDEKAARERGLAQKDRDASELEHERARGEAKP